MAEAPVDLSTGDNLEQKILQVLSDASGPVKIGQLLKKCQVPKKNLNQVLYRLKKEGRVSSSAPATWSLGGAASGDGVPATPQDSTAQPSLDERILRFLEAQGPHRALHIAKALGMTTAKEVNPILYAMRSKHLLSYDGRTWSIYRSSREGQELEVSATTADPETSFNMQTPEPGPHPEGDTAQKVHIKSCLLEDATIGNSNKMTIHPRSKGGVRESGDSEEPKENTGASSEATPPRSCLHTPRDSMLLTSELRAMVLGDSSPQTTEPSLRENEVQDTESCQTRDCGEERGGEGTGAGGEACGAFCGCTQGLD